MNLEVCHREGCEPILETLPPILVRCRNCGLGGSPGVSLEDAAERWNREIILRMDVYFGERKK
jgi:hypothetical protein